MGKPKLEDELPFHQGPFTLQLEQGKIAYML